VYLKFWHDTCAHILTYSKTKCGPCDQRQEAQHILLRKILGGNYHAPVHELLNDNRHHERKVVDLCTGTGHWYVVDLFPSLTPHPVLE
jgi:hypothetical protein